MRFLPVLLAIALCLVPVRAQALTLRDIVELHKAGLGDDVLVALIEVHKGVFSLDPDTMKSLKSDGLSDRVLIAIINSGRPPRPEPAPVTARVEPPPAPTVIVIEHHVDHSGERHEPSPQVIIQQVPVFVPVAGLRSPSRQAHRERTATAGSPFYVGQVPAPGSPHSVGRVPQPPTRKAPEPVYWGFGGKLRPDAWPVNAKCQMPNGKC